MQKLRATRSIHGKDSQNEISYGYCNDLSIILYKNAIRTNVSSLCMERIGIKKKTNKESIVEILTRKTCNQHRWIDESFGKTMKAKTNLQVIFE